MTNEKPRRGCQGIFFWLLILAAVPLVLFFAAVLYVSLKESAARAELHDRVQALGASGEPIDYITLDQKHQEYSRSRDSAAWLLFLEQVQKAVSEASPEEVEYWGDPTLIPLPGEEWEDEQLARDFLARIQPLLEKLQEMKLDGQPVYVPIIKTDIMDVDLSKTMHSRSVMMLLQCQGRMAVREGNADLLMKTILTMRDVSFMHSAEPLLLSQLLCAAEKRQTGNLIADGLEHDVFDAAQLALLRRLIEPEMDVDSSFRRAMEGERAFAAEIYTNPNAAVDGKLAYYPFRGTDGLHHLNYLESILELFPPEGETRSDLDGLLSKADELEASMETELNNANIYQKWQRVMSAMLTPALGRIARSPIDYAQSQRLLYIAIGIRQFEKLNGRLPKNLEELSEIEIDVQRAMPVGGRPFAYQDVDGEKTLWGFSVQTMNSTPIEPVTEDQITGGMPGTVIVFRKSEP